MMNRYQLAADLIARAASVTEIEVEFFGPATELLMPNGTKVLIHRDNVCAHMSKRGKLTVDGVTHHVKRNLRGVGAVWYSQNQGKNPSPRTERRACLTLHMLATA